MNREMRLLTLLMLPLVLTLQVAIAQNNFGLGVRIQKTPNLYYENGFSIDYSSSTIWHNKLHLGASYTSSRLGSALGSNALKQDNFLVSAALYLRGDKRIKPIVGLNLGYFMVDTEFEMFDMLPNSSFLISAELGLKLYTSGPLSFQSTVGYNIISGNGIDGPGSLYPIFLNFTTLYKLKGGKK